MTSRRRALGIVRVSQVAKRDEELDRFASPELQQERIATICKDQGLDLIETIREMDVSGGTPLERRHGLRRAVEMVEDRKAEVVVVAYFDRLFRSLRVQEEVVSRIEAKGGRVLAADIGDVTNGTAAKWLSSTMLGMVAEYVRRTTAERTTGAQKRAVKEGRPPFPLIPGYRRTANGIEADPEKVGPVVEAFRMRAAGATIASIHEHLASHGIKRSYHGVQSLLRSRLVLGEIHFGDQHEVDVVTAIVDADTWDRVQKAAVSRGRRAKSDRLLARLGVLRCATCGSKMVVGSSNNSAYVVYRCPPINDCTRHVTISADLVERVVIDEVRRLVDEAEELEEIASAEAGYATAVVDRDRAQAEFDSGIRVLATVSSEPAAIERLAELREARDAANDRCEDLAAAHDARSAARTIGDWDKLTLDGRRGLIRAVIDKVTVAPGRGADRIKIAARTADASDRRGA